MKKSKKSLAVSHEVPLSILEQSREFNDYSYALVHLFKTEPEYFQFFKDELKNGRVVYLDNSLFETESMFDHDEFARAVKELGSINPDNFYYIVPDSLEESKITMDSFTDFTKAYPDLPGKSIGVVQGKNYEEIKECYEFMSSNADVIAISFDYSYYQELFSTEKNKFHSWMKGRQYLINKLIADVVWDYEKPHHLLGCGLPQEFSAYNDIESIVSCDTSNPVVHGILGIRYEENGLQEKQSIKLVELFNTELNKLQLTDIEYNVGMFKKLTK